MLAHIEEVQHLHPHPAGLAWEALLLGLLVLLVVAVVVVAMLRRTLSLRRLDVSPAHQSGASHGEGRVSR